MDDGYPHIALKTRVTRNPQPLWRWVAGKLTATLHATKKGEAIAATSHPMFTFVGQTKKEWRRMGKRKRGKSFRVCRASVSLFDRKGWWLRRSMGEGWKRKTVTHNYENLANRRLAVFCKNNFSTKYIVFPMINGMSFWSTLNKIRFWLYTGMFDPYSKGVGM